MVGEAKGVYPLFPVPDWLVRPQRGDVFRSTLCFGKERGSRTAAGLVGGARSLTVVRREPPPVVPRECAGRHRKEEGFPRRAAACEVSVGGAQETWVSYSRRLDVPST